MKIKIFIVTYNNLPILYKNIDSLNKSIIFNPNHNIEINIINNYSIIKLHKKYKNINIFNNTIRPDFSTGHLSRNWNQCIINGFKNINKPDCDILICCQDDIEFRNDWIKNLIRHTKKYNFITFGAGDAFHCYTINAIKTIGLWDEYFCNIGYQEADYFLRALLYNEKKSSINDLVHKRILNLTNNNVIIDGLLTGFQRKETYHINSKIYHNISEKYFQDKWNTNDYYWKRRDEIMKLKPLIKRYILYPYFEKNIEEPLEKLL